jgi:hypothetical protein
MILQTFNIPVSQSTKLGTVADILSIDCCAHRSLLLMAIPEFSKYATKYVVHRGTSATKDTITVRTCQDDSIILNLDNTKQYFWSQFLSLSNKNRNAAHRGYGRVVHHRWIDMRLVRNWISICDYQHGKSCRRAFYNTKIARHRPNLLIDTWRKCLWKVTSDESYVAFSYVWGNTPNLMTTQANVEIFQQPGSLGREEIACLIPKSIRDAISLTELLHERYLWIDSLCIVQDDEKNSHSELTKMASIYANAALTIVAANGEDANHGLRGIRGVSFPRNHPQRGARLSNGALVLQRYTPDLGKSTWSKRGWTFQETVFSQRKLIFCEESIMWKCPCATWYEDVGLLQQKDPRPLPLVFGPHISKLFSTSWPDLRGYQQLVCDFNRRDLTYPEDVVDAFSGVTTPLSAMFHGGFFYGLSETFFDIALLWIAESDLVRRIPKRGNSSKSKLPNWSWMGWQGTLNHLCGLEDWKKEAGHRLASIQTIPLVQWYTYDKEKSLRRKVRINSDWFKYKESCYLNSGAEMPVGWNRYHYDPKPEDHDGSRRFPECRIPKYFFKHNSDESAEFWYPITIPEEATIPESSSHLPFILCRTSRCWLDVTADIRESRLFGCLRDGAGTWAGTLNAHNCRFSFPDSTRKPLLSLARCELIAISTGIAHGYPNGPNPFCIRESNCKERPQTHTYEFYNVLWIEWEDGIAYRKGVGRVEKSRWEAQPLEWIDVTLG